MSSEEYRSNSVDATLSRIETKLDATLERVDSLEKIVRDLDRFKFYILGASVIAGAVVSAAVTLFKKQ